MRFVHEKGLELNSNWNSHISHEEEKCVNWKAKGKSYPWHWDGNATHSREGIIFKWRKPYPKLLATVGPTWVMRSEPSTNSQFFISVLNHLPFYHSILCYLLCGVDFRNFLNISEIPEHVFFCLHILETLRVHPIARDGFLLTSFLSVWIISGLLGYDLSPKRSFGLKAIVVLFERVEGKKGWEKETPCRLVR